VEYNLLNLPKKVIKGTENISYIYSATGTKLAMLKGTTVVNFYAGMCVYKGNKTLDYTLHPEGVVRAIGQGLSYEYFLKDHLGNTRVVFGSDGAVLQTTDYYAFGMAHTPKAKENENRYLYNGKEQQDALIGGVKFDWYDYGARFYDPTIGRWHSIDPRAEELNNLTPYNYVANNPIIANDPDGEFLNVVIGAVVGAVFEMTSQVVSNMIQGQGFGETFKNMDWADVGISAAEGALVATGVGAVAAGIGGAIAKSAVDVKQGAEGWDANVIGAGKNEETFGKDLIGNLAGVATGGLVSKQVGNFVGDKMAGLVIDKGFNSVAGYIATSAAEVASQAITDGVTNGLWNKTYDNYLYKGSALRPIKIPEVTVTYDRKTKSLVSGEQKKVHDHIKKHGYKTWLQKQSE